MIDGDYEFGLGNGFLYIIDNVIMQVMSPDHLFLPFLFSTKVSEFASGYSKNGFRSLSILVPKDQIQLTS